MSRIWHPSFLNAMSLSPVYMCKKILMALPLLAMMMSYIVHTPNIPLSYTLQDGGTPSVTSPYGTDG